MRLGIVLAGFTSLPAADFVAAAREAEARGYHTAWLGEVAGYDALVITIVATHTERLVVANGVLPVQTRTPVVLGLATASLNHLAPGRFALGLGLSSKTIVEQWHGLTFSPALAQIREAVEIIRKVATGERVNQEGKFYRVKNFRLTGPAPKAPVRIYLAALGPEMLELAGEIADGVLLNWIPPERCGLDRASEAAPPGRPPGAEIALRRTRHRRRAAAAGWPATSPATPPWTSTRFLPTAGCRRVAR
jgi:alkanesulfonate monooxygenase SsuD/methylene tetrahydromethanopterin reductase-like flavin-dependent oxidoreductase (luciferase family)